MPEIKSINPSAEEALFRFSSLCTSQRELCLFLCASLEKEYGFSAVSGSIPLSVLTPLAEKKEKKALLYELCSQMASKENISISFERFHKLIPLLKHPIEGKIIEISDGFSFSVREKNFVFSKYDPHDSGIEYRMELTDGNNLIEPLDQILTIGPKMPGKVLNINKKLLIIEVASDRIEGRLSVRNYVKGDRIVINKMRKSVKKLFCDLHIPPSLRKNIPLICDEKEILWVPFIGLCDKARDPSSCEKITLTLSGGKLKDIQELID
jgi:tRNA(Ile)-lysidine synthetase-like protein